MIATDVGGLKEFVDDERTGIIVGRPEPLAIASGIQRFYALGPAHFAPHLEAAREGSSWSRFAEQLVDFAKDVRASEGR
ncbi:MAG: hypothetical protein IPL52_05195 [Flavobacteriales bacterium]|nr:hypothetical protein [Flavobacteriales bacterium]